MTELALVLPVLVLLLFAVIQFGIAFNNYVTITDAARAGARQAAVSLYGGKNPVSEAESAARNSAQNLDQGKLDVSVTAAGGWTKGADVTVTATYPYSISLLGVVVKSGDLTSSTTERLG